VIGRRRMIPVLLVTAALLLAASGCGRSEVRVGSKLDTESVTLGEMATRLARSGGAGLVLLAHHRRDQAETFLLQALRGGGVSALSAMPASATREGLTWSRPWLATPDATIAAYARRHRLRWVEDDSNADVGVAARAPTCVLALRSAHQSAYDGPSTSPSPHLKTPGAPDVARGLVRTAGSLLQRGRMICLRSTLSA